MATPMPRREPEFEGGSQPVPELPPDEPGRGRGWLVTATLILGILILAMPIAWGLGALTTVGEVVGTGGLILLWVTWALMLLAFLWLAWSMWRRSA